MGPGGGGEGNGVSQLGGVGGGGHKYLPLGEAYKKVLTKAAAWAMQCKAKQARMDG